MKITTENNVSEFILDKINNVYIGFDDTEIILKDIVEYDIDLDRVDCSTIEFTNAFSNVELENYFIGNKNNNIIYVHIEASGIVMENYVCRNIDVYYDIPCKMTIRRLRSHGNYKDAGNMFVQLEGFVG